jgi:hypothetical protein
VGKLRSLFLTITLISTLVLIQVFVSSTSSKASPDEVKWSSVDIPLPGEAGSWVLASGSDIRHLAIAADGTLYCHANPTGTSYTLFKSTDGGFSWAHTGAVTDDIVDIATAPGDASAVYYATISNIYQSSDGGASFSQLPAVPGGTGSGNVTITSLAVTQQGGNKIVAVGIADGDPLEYGGVYLYDDQSASWTDTGIGNYDVYAPAFSPSYAVDQQLMAVVSDEQDIFIADRFGNESWGATVSNAPISNLVPVSAALAFPDDYDAAADNYTLFVAVDISASDGDVYKVVGTRATNSQTATDLDAGAADSLASVDISGLATSGASASANLLAGRASSTQVYISNDGGLNWTKASKKPSGPSRTEIVMASDFVSNGTAYVATSGTESAFSLTSDGGSAWNQIGLIDTRISSGGILDLAVSPRYTSDHTLFMLTFDSVNTEHSLWRSSNNELQWERIFSTSVAGADSFSMAEISPAFGSNSQVIFLVGSSGGNPSIWRSANSGQIFSARTTPYAIDTWTATDDDTLFLGSYDGSNGLIYRTTDGGLSFSTEVIVGSQPLHSIAISPDYASDATLIVGSTGGWIYLSQDNGNSFKPLPNDATSPPLTDDLSVAFDPEFSTNEIVFAASNTVTTANDDERIFRFAVGRSSIWDSIRSSLPVGTRLSQITLSSRGIFYAANAKSGGGMERSLNPTFPLNPTFETVTRGLDDDAILSGFWVNERQLWSIDTQNTKLMTFTDSLNRPPSLLVPLHQAPGLDTASVVLDWKTRDGATEYQWQLDHDNDFSSVPDEFEGTTSGSSVRLPVLEPATTYYWRVRVSGPILSPWSAKWSFTTALGGTTTAPQLLNPAPGEGEVPLKPIFQWGAIAGAATYELLVATDPNFTDLVIDKSGDNALPATAWQSDAGLDDNTTYYWKVRGKSANSYSNWSAVGAFTARATSSDPSNPSEQQSNTVQPFEPVENHASPSVTVTPPPPPPEPQSVPSSSPSQPTTTTIQLIVPEWAIYLAVSLLSVTVLLTIITLVIVIKR